MLGATLRGHKFVKKGDAIEKVEIFYLEREIAVKRRSHYTLICAPAPCASVGLLLASPARRSPLRSAMLLAGRGRPRRGPQPARS